MLIFCRHFIDEENGKPLFIRLPAIFSLLKLFVVRSFPCAYTLKKNYFFSYFIVYYSDYSPFVTLVTSRKHHGVISTTSSPRQSNSLHIFSIMARLTGSFFPSLAKVALLIPTLSLNSVFFMCLSISVFHSLSYEIIFVHLLLFFTL